jgi:HEAT repeat protein
MNYVSRLSSLAVICSLFFRAAIAQGIPPVSHRGRSSAEALNSYGIDVSKESLLAALSNANPRVRVLAADQLAYQHDSDAVPAIEQAYSVEKDSMTRVGIAAALSSLKDPAGVEFLQTICRDGTSPIKTTIAAAQMLELFDASGKECIDIIISSLTRPADAD